MRNLFLINGTEYIWALSEEKAKEIYATDVLEDVETAELIAADRPIFIQDPLNCGDGLWRFKLHDGWKLIKETTVGEFFSGYCGDYDLIVYSTEW